MKVIVFLYAFMFVCLFKAHATTPVPKPKTQPPVNHTAQTQPKDCVKHPQIVKTVTVPQRLAEKSKPNTDKVVKIIPINKPTNTVPHFSVLNFINFFYSKDSLDNLHVM